MQKESDNTQSRLSSARNYEAPRHGSFTVRGLSLLEGTTRKSLRRNMNKSLVTFHKPIEFTKRQIPSLFAQQAKSTTSAKNSLRSFSKSIFLQEKRESLLLTKKRLLAMDAPVEVQQMISTAQGVGLTLKTKLETVTKNKATIELKDAKQTRKTKAIIKTKGRR